RIRNLGQTTKGHHVELGLNERLDGIQAAALRVKLPRLDGWNRARRNLASLYRRELAGCCRLLGEHPDAECVYHLFPVRVAEGRGVRAGLPGPGPRPGLPCGPARPPRPPLRGLPSSGAPLPGATRWSEEEVSLPMFPEMSEGEALAVVDAFRRAVGV